MLFTLPINGIINSRKLITLAFISTMLQEGDLSQAQQLDASAWELNLDVSSMSFKAHFCSWYRWQQKGTVLEIRIVVGSSSYWNVQQLLLSWVLWAGGKSSRRILMRSLLQHGFYHCLWILNLESLLQVLPAVLSYLICFIKVPFLCLK